MRIKSRTVFMDKHLGMLSRTTQFFGGDGGDGDAGTGPGPDTSTDMSFGGFKSAERGMGLDSVGTDDSGSGDGGLGGLSRGGYGIGGVNDSSSNPNNPGFGRDRGGDDNYSVSFNKDDSATVTNKRTGESVSVKDGVAISGSMDGFGVEPGDVKSAGLNAKGQFEETMVTEPGKTMVNTYTDETKTTLIGATGDITLFGLPAKINVDYTGKTTITSGGYTASIDAYGNITGDKNMFSGDDVGGVKGAIAGIKGMAKTISNSTPAVAKALIGLAVGGIPGGVAGALSEDKTLSLAEQRNMAQLQGLADMASNPNTTSEDINRFMSSMDDGNGNSIITGKPITAFDAKVTGVSTEGLPVGTTTDATGGTSFVFDKDTLNNAYTRADRSRGEIIQEIFREGLGRDVNQYGYDYWLNTSLTPTDQLYDTMRKAALENGEMFNDFDLNRTSDFSKGNLLRQDNIDIAKSQFEIAKGQLESFERFYGNPLANYNAWFKRLDPYQAQALGQSEIKQNYMDIKDQTISDFARRGIDSGGVLSSVLTNFDISEAEALAANRAQNMANYTTIAQQDAAIRQADIQNKFNMRNTLTSNQFNAAANVMGAQNTYAGALDSQTQFNTQMDLNRAMSLADMDYKYAALGVQDAANKAQIAYNERALQAGIANSAANRDAQEESDKWALGTTLFTSLLS